MARFTQLVYDLISDGMWTVWNHSPHGAELWVDKWYKDASMDCVLNTLVAENIAAAASYGPICLPA